MSDYLLLPDSQLSAKEILLGRLIASARLRLQRYLENLPDDQRGWDGRDAAEHAKTFHETVDAAYKAFKSPEVKADIAMMASIQFEYSHFLEGGDELRNSAIRIFEMRLAAIERHAAMIEVRENPDKPKTQITDEQVNKILATLGATAETRKPISWFNEKKLSINPDTFRQDNKNGIVSATPQGKGKSNLYSVKDLILAHPDKFLGVIGVKSR